MSDYSQGPGWWQASDGKWYPPESASGAAAPTPTPGAGGVPAGGMPAGGAPMPGGPAMGSAPMSMGLPDGPVDAKSFVSSLYDFQFDHFVTPKVIRFFYAFFVIVLSLGGAIMVLVSLATLAREPAAGLFLLLFVVIMYFVYLIMTRIWFELIAALFRIADDLRAIRRGKGL